VSLDLNRCPKGTRYNEVAVGTTPGASYKESGSWSTGCTQAVIVVWLQSTTSVIHPRCCLHTRVNAPTRGTSSWMVARSSLGAWHCRSSGLGAVAPRGAGTAIDVRTLGCAGGDGARAARGRRAVQELLGMAGSATAPRGRRGTRAGEQKNWESGEGKHLCTTGSRHDLVEMKVFTSGSGHDLVVIKVFTARSSRIPSVM
jgi:hypothetical protein